uniref:Alanyl-transfer RNA synthetases family profile domain-containing protein n=1 Tax=Ditylenchus dipsaci TaxID=166011 RepID=A0A915D1S5_9BILA
MQNKVSNYDTDLFTPIFEAIQGITGAPSYAGKIGSEDVNQVDTSYRIVADHIRTLTVGLSDGVVPDHHDRGYLMRRILRRAVRCAGENLGAKSGHIASIVPVVVQSLGEAFPELHRNCESVMKTINKEESQYRELLRDALRICRETIREEQTWKFVPGDFAWRLQAVHALPLELTKEVAEDHGLTVNMKEYEEARQKASVNDV